MTKIIQNLKDVVESMMSNPCTFWACKGKPQNNRIEHMITCSNCQNIIELNRIIKKLENEKSKS